MRPSNFALAVLLPGALLAAMAGLAHACNTPVYRYAMYNWPPARYVVFWIHDGPSSEGGAIAKRLKEASETQGETANVEYVDVNAAEAKQMSGLPEQVKKAWQARDKKLKALHLVFSPWGAQLFAGRLEPGQLPGLLQSPARKRICEMLREGNAAVFLVIAAPSAQRTREVEKVIDRVAQQAKSGEIALRTEDPAAPPGAPKEEHAQKPRGPRVTRLTIDRKDAAEDWLLRPLLSVEEDTHEFAKEPLVFAVYGRGRALPPFIGKGITEENLTECVGFLAGACSCVIKDQNPGADLLMTWDWDATAQGLAADDEDTDGGQASYREVAMPDAPATTAGGTKSEPVAKAVASDSAKSTSGFTTPIGKKKAEAPKQLTLPPAAIAAPPPTAPAAPPASFAGAQMRLYGAAAVVAAVTVLVVGYFWTRRKSHPGL